MSDTQTNSQVNSIAIVAIAGRFPKAPTLEHFWHNLASGVEAVSFFSDDQLLASGVNPSYLRHPNYVRARNVLENVELFDAGFFGYTAREAMLLDPQQRVFLEIAWEALERSGYCPENYAGGIGVFAGSSRESYLWNNVNANDEARNSAGDYRRMVYNQRDFLATRVSYKLSLKGPSVVVQSACSTSLVAVHMACQSLLNYECDMALAGGVSISFPQVAGNFFQEGGILSPDGHCRAFDARAQGCVGGDGCGIVLLKRLSDALEDGDQICAVIRGSAVNNDGSHKVGFTAPSVEGQANVIAMALASAGVSPDSISYVEAHGTGTPLGDPIEVAALNRVFRSQTSRERFCAIGSLKPNIGHLDAAAGVAGLIKAVLALQHKQLPPTINFEIANQKIDFDHSPLYVNSALQPWEAQRTPRRAGVSSFGIGGTNAHVILEEAPPSGVTLPASCPKWQALVVSGRGPDTLSRIKMNILGHLRKNPGIDLGDLAYTLQSGRRHFAARDVIVCSTRDQAIAALEDRTESATLRAMKEQGDAPTIPTPDQATEIVRRLQQATPADPAIPSLLLALGKLWVNGCQVNWGDLHFPHRHNRIALPTYPFERERYWIAPTPERSSLEMPGHVSPTPQPVEALLPSIARGKQAALPALGLIEAQLDILSEQLRVLHTSAVGTTEPRH